MTRERTKPRNMQLCEVGSRYTRNHTNSVWHIVFFPAVSGEGYGWHQERTPRSNLTSLLLRTGKTVIGISAPRWNIITGVPAGHQYFQENDGIIYPVVFPSLPHGTTAPSGPRPPHYRGFTITLRHTTLVRTPLYEWSACRRDLYLTPHITHKRQISNQHLRPQGHWDWRPSVLTVIKHRGADNAIVRPNFPLYFVWWWEYILWC